MGVPVGSTHGEANDKVHYTGIIFNNAEISLLQYRKLMSSGFDFFLFNSKW